MDIDRSNIVWDYSPTVSICIRQMIKDGKVIWEERWTEVGGVRIEGEASMEAVANMLLSTLKKDDN